MPIPTYDKLMLPLLQVASDKNEHSLKDAIEIIASKLSLTDNERNQLLPGGSQKTFNNRIGWARTYLKKAGLLEAPKRGFFRITERGLGVIKNNPQEITDELLTQFPEFRDFISLNQYENTTEIAGTSIQANEKTPEEIIENNFTKLKRILADELLEKIKLSSPGFFERLVVDLIVAMGYGGSRQDAAQVVGGTGDTGIDGIIKEDKLGLDAIYIQAKRWDGSVGRPVVQAFVGSLSGHRANKGILITTSTFTKDAIDYVKNIEKKIILINGEMLTNLMIEHNVGVTASLSYTLKKIDSDYFEE